MNTQPKTGIPCACRPGAERNNCQTCEGTGLCVDHARIRATPLQFEQIGREFSRLLREELTAEEMEIVIARNRLNPPGICASHDFRDANEVMADAFRTVTGREISAQSEDDAALWSAAWDFAKAKNFSP